MLSYRICNDVSIIIPDHSYDSLALPYLTLPCPALTCLTLPYLTLPYLAWHCLAMPCLNLPCLVLYYISSLDLFSSSYVVWYLGNCGDQGLSMHGNSVFMLEILRPGCHRSGQGWWQRHHCKCGKITLPITFICMFYSFFYSILQ